MRKVADLFPDGKPLNPSDGGYYGAVQSILTQDPPEARVNDKANNSLYVPIQISEELLDFLFPLSWSFEFRQATYIVNEVVMDGELVIDCGPVKIRRWGSGAEPIQLKSGSNVLDLGGKITNTLAKDYPNAKSEAFRNACKNLGNVFGRNLNRKNADRTNYNPERVLDNGLVDNLKQITDKEQFNKAFLALPKEFRNDPTVKAIIETKKQQLNQLDL